MWSMLRKIDGGAVTEADVKRVEFELWAMTDEINRKKAALRKKRKELKDMKAKLKKAMNSLKSAPKQ